MSFILDALRKLEEKRAPETTRELLAAGIPGPHKHPRGKPFVPYIVTAAVVAGLLAAGGWFAVNHRAGGGEGEPPAPPSSRSTGGGESPSLPGLSTAGGENQEEAGTAPAPPLPAPDAPGNAPIAVDLEIPLPEREGRSGKEIPEIPPSPGAVNDAPLPLEDGEGSVVPGVTASAGVGQPPSPGESAATPLLPFPELPEEIRGSLKDLRIEGHVYSDDPGFRLLSIDGSLRREGDTVRPGLLIEKISPEGAVFTYRGYRFSMKGY